MTAAKTSDVRWLVKDALAVIFKRKRLIAGLFLIVAAGISLAVLSAPASYEVAGKLVVTRARGDILVTPADQRNFNFALTAPTVQDMAVHAEMLKNRSLIEAVARKVGVDTKKEAQSTTDNVVRASLTQQISVWLPWASSAMPQPDAAPSEQSRLNSAVDKIVAGLNVQVVPNSNLIIVRYRGSDGAKGAEVVNTLLDLYRDRYLDFRRNPGVLEFFTDQRDQLQRNVKNAEDALKSFQKRSNLVSANVQIDAYIRRLAEAEKNLVDSQFDKEEAIGRLDRLRTELEKQPERLPSSSSVKFNPLIQTMQERLLTLEMDKQRLLTLYTDNDRRVVDKNLEIEAQKARLADTQKQPWVPDTEVSLINDRRRDLEEKILSAELTIQRNAVRLQGATAIADEMKQQVRDLGIADVEKQALLREVTASSEAYLLYRRKAEEARVAAALDDNKITNVAIGEMASGRGTPVGPPKNLSLVFAVMVGLVSGVGAAFVREFFDGSIKSEREIRSSVDLPVLGTISEEKNGKTGNGHKNGNGKNGNGNGGNGKHGVEG